MPLQVPLLARMLCDASVNFGEMHRHVSCYGGSICTLHAMCMISAHRHPVRERERERERSITHIQIVKVRAWGRYALVRSWRGAQLSTTGMQRPHLDQGSAHAFLHAARQLLSFKCAGHLNAPLVPICRVRALPQYIHNHDLCTPEDIQAGLYTL